MQPQLQQQQNVLQQQQPGASPESSTPSVHTGEIPPTPQTTSCEKSLSPASTDDLSLANSEENIDVSSIQNHGHAADSDLLKSQQDPSLTTGSLKKVGLTYQLLQQHYIYI